MNNDNLEAEVAKLLPCVQPKVCKGASLPHFSDCPAYYCAAVAAWARKLVDAAHVAGMREAMEIMELDWETAGSRIAAAIAEREKP